MLLSDFFVVFSIHLFSFSFTVWKSVYCFAETPAITIHDIQIKILE
jgi:hypothetical protein